MGKEHWKQTAARVKAFLLQDKKRALVLLLPGGTKGARASPDPGASTAAPQPTEEKLCALLGAIRGVGRVRVMLHFATNGETVYAQNSDSTQQASDGKKEKNSVVIVKNGQSETGLVVREESPRVTGAAVVCEGGGDPVVRACVVETLSALLGIKSNHISVMPM